MFKKGILWMVCCIFSLQANYDSSGFCLSNTINAENVLCFYDVNKTRPKILKKHLLKKITKAQRWVAVMLALPFPFGIIGLHRIYMGTAPHVPVVYIASFGGVFGILPFIDFCILVLDKKYERYFNNPRVFMWIEPATSSENVLYTPVKN